MTAKIQSIYRYPVKGLSPEKLDRAHLTAGAFFPGDRLFAIENGPSGFDPAAPVHQPKTKYLMLMRDDRLATLRTRYEDATSTLSIVHEGRNAVQADIATNEGRLTVEAFFRRFMPHDLRGPPRCWQRRVATASRTRAVALCRSSISRQSPSSKP